jgi:hypothetical protein
MKYKLTFAQIFKLICIPCNLKLQSSVLNLKLIFKLIFVRIYLVNTLKLLIIYLN